MNSQHPRWTLLALALGCAACATLANAASGGNDLPNAGAGPFRELRSDELGNFRSAPNVMVDDQTFPRDVAILDADGDPSTPEVFGYFAITPHVGSAEPDPLAPPGAIVRYGALDGRSFDRAPITVLEPQEPWEGMKLGAPTVLRVGDEVFLYYTAEGGIGLARSTDGMSFTREKMPVLAEASSGWDAALVPENPGVVRLDDGSLRMFYDVVDDKGVGKIGEATSLDGLSWERVGTAAVLEPQVDVDPKDPSYDDASVEAPFPVLAASSEGRSILRVYYGARDVMGNKSIGLAARYEPAQGALERAVGPVFSGSLGPGQPCVVVCPGYSFLFVTEQQGTSKSQQIPAVAGGVSPADVVLPPHTQ